jgi:hypothetical protein
MSFEFTGAEQRQQFEKATRDYMYRLQAIGIPTTEVEFTGRGAAGSQFAVSGTDGKEIARLEKLAKEVGDRDLAKYYEGKAAELKKKWED